MKANAVKKSTWAVTAMSLFASLAVSSPARAESGELDGFLLYGISGSNALVQYSFADRQLETIGQIHLDDGRIISDVQGMSCIPGHLNTYAIWIDPEDNRTKLLYINTETAAATVVNDNVEGGTLGGATTAVAPEGEPYWRAFGVQLKKTNPPIDCDGWVNLNPNNSPHNLFEAETPTGMYTRDSLHRDAPVQSLPDGKALLYTGPASRIRFKPKGHGNQNTLLVINDDGTNEPMLLQNSNTYTFSGDMTVTIINDHFHNSRAMGHWWIQITGTGLTIEDDVSVSTPDRLVEFNHKTGEVHELLPLQRGYDSLTTPDGQTFYAAKDGEIYRIDPVNNVESRLGSLPSADIEGLAFTGSKVAAFSTTDNQLLLLDILPGGTGSVTPVSIGATDLRTIVLTKVKPVGQPTYD